MGSGDFCNQGTDCKNHYAGLRCIDNGELGFYDFKIAPYCDWTPTGIDEKQSEYGYELSPNPAQGYFTLKLKNESGMRDYRLKVSNQMGQMVYTQNIREASTRIEVTWPSDLYFYQLESEGLPVGNGKIVVP